MLLHILLLMMLSFFCCADGFAAPAAPEPVTISQPDGSLIKVVTRGDEFQNWTESEETGHTIMRNEATGYWEYAEQSESEILRPSGIRVLPHGVNAPKAFPKGLRPPRNHEYEKQMRQMIRESYEQRLSSSAAYSGATSSSGSETAQAAPGDWTPAPVSGTRKMLIILVSFADRAIKTTPDSWSGAVFNAGIKSVAKFYKENSFDALNVTPVPHTQPGGPVGVVSVTLTTNHPNLAGNFTFSSDQSWGNAALAKAAPFVDFISLDTNGDGKLDTTEAVIYFIAAGYETSAGSGLTPSMWAHAWRTTGIGLTAGTKNVQRWALNGEYYNSRTQMTMGVIAHELGHQMCGLPDLYDISGNNEALGAFSVMASGSWGANTGETAGATPTTLDAWSREFLGWAVPVIPSGSGAISLGYPLTSADSVYKLAVPTSSTTEYFLVENRRPTSWDLGLKLFLGNWQGGLLITHIDNTAGTSGLNDINSYSATLSVPGHQGVVPVQASTAACNMLIPGTTCSGAATTLFYSTNNSSFTGTTNPNSNFYNGLPTNLAITGISAPAATMTATLSLLPSVTIETAPPSLTNNPAGTFIFSSDDQTATFTCSVDSGTYAACSSPFGTGMLSDGSHNFIVRAANGAGSNEAEYNWTIDTAAPETLLISGPPDPTSATNAVFVFSSPDTTAEFECRLDEGSYAPCYSGISYSGLAAGNHVFNVRAGDQAGNMDPTPATHFWMVTSCHAKIGAACYESVAAAYAAAQTGDTILAEAMTFPDGLNADRGISFTLRGGYDAAFSTVVGFTTIPWLTISTDTLDMAGFAL